MCQIVNWALTNPTVFFPSCAFTANRSRSPSCKGMTTLIWKPSKALYIHALKTSNTQHVNNKAIYLISCVMMAPLEFCFGTWTLDSRAYVHNKRYGCKICCECLTGACLNESDKVQRHFGHLYISATQLVLSSTKAEWRLWFKAGISYWSNGLCWKRVIAKVSAINFLPELPLVQFMDAEPETGALA